jgi:hypothetical protein
MKEADGRHSVTLPGGHGVRELQKALGTHEIGLKTRPERIAAPGDAGGFIAGAAQQGVVEDNAIGRPGRQLGSDGAADNGKDLWQGKTVFREKAVRRGPVLKLASGYGEQASHGVAPETEQRTQREDLRTPRMETQGPSSYASGSLLYRTGTGKRRRWEADCAVITPRPVNHLAGEGRSGLDTVRDILEAVSKGAGMNVGMGTLPMNLLFQTTGTSVL